MNFTLAPFCRGRSVSGPRKILIEAYPIETFEVPLTYSHIGVNL